MTHQKIFGLIGYPVKHSLSPLMHNAAFSRFKIKAKYKLFPLEERQLKDFLSGLKKKGICGLNVTIPYKEKVLDYIKSTSEGVRIIRAANTLVIDKAGKIRAHNTDCLGFARHVKELKVKPKKVAIIGAGGAAKAVIFALIKLKAQEICIYDIDKFRVLALVKRFNQLFSGGRVRAVACIDELSLSDKDLLVNTTPIGMRETDPLLIEPRNLHKDLFVYDLIYNPAETKLLSTAKVAGCRYSNGLGMLLYQGVEALEIWLKPKKAPVEVMRAALLKGVSKL
ncbi:MAG: shikimate dehydrogenase [Candidatus Omnitrophica bacterium]|nr:shikimate dehydrogenase [Candidatus Omnitrophota bacterium]